MNAFSRGRPFATILHLLTFCAFNSRRAESAINPQALPQIAQLIEEKKLGEAYAIAVQAERYIPHDPMLVKFWPDFSWTAAIHTTPSGVAVYRRNYNAP